MTLDPAQSSITALLVAALQLVMRIYDGRKGTPVQRVEQLEVTVAGLKRSNNHRYEEIEELGYRVRQLERKNEASG
jgi:hypothetical protein